MSLRIGIITGSTRPGRVNRQVAEWVHEQASERAEAEFELIDIADYDLPLLDEPMPPSMANKQYSKPHAQRWSAKIDELDGFIFIVPEYNHGVTGALKNAIDFLYPEWNNKAAGFVSYGSAGGVRAVEHLRGTMAELQIADVRVAPFLSLGSDFENYSVFKPREFQADSLSTMFTQLEAWASSLKPLRV